MLTGWVLALGLFTPPALAASSNITVSLADSGKAAYFSGKHNITVTYDATKKAMAFTTTGQADPYVTLNLSKLASVSATTYKYVVVNYSAPAGSEGAGNTQLFWKVNSKAYAEARSTSFGAVRGGASQSQVIDLSKQSFWTGPVNSVRVDPFASGAHKGDVLYISSLVFCTTQQQANAARVGSTSTASADTASSGSASVTTQTSTHAATDTLPASINVALNNASAAAFFTNGNGLGVAYDQAARAIRLMTTGTNDPYVTLNLSAATGYAAIPVNTYHFAVLKYRVPVTNAQPADMSQLFWRFGDDGIAEERSTRFLVTRTGAECTQVIGLDSLAGGGGSIDAVRIDPFVSGTPAGETMYLSSITFVKDALAAATTAGTATYTTATGLAFSPSGHTSGNATSGFGFNAGMTIALDPTHFTSSFNRLSLTYTASAPLMMVVDYGQGNTTGFDTLYLDAGTNVTFNALIDTYLSGGVATTIRQICLSPLSGTAATFCLHDLTTSLVPTYPGKMVYVTNGNYTLGACLGYGGAINYLKDWNCPVSGIDNLVNQYDTGRLIQQSYYGAGPAEGYYAGYYNNNDWRYNPVQGGDQHLHESRIIDLQVSANSIYVKAQPMDWALNNHITPSYMENTYTLDDKVIDVENRFTDYSGMNHPNFPQELPALYTLGYFNRFTYYAGERPWQNDALTIQDDLPFWGASAEVMARCSFPISTTNTERWCAWTSSQRDYGLGLNVSLIDQFVAGRVGTSKTKSDRSLDCSYVTAHKFWQQVSFKPFTYSYQLTTGSLSEIRSRFAPAGTVAAGGGSADIASGKSVSATFNQAGTEYWLTGLNDFVAGYDASQGAAKLVSVTGFDPYAYLDIKGLGANLIAENFGKLNFTYMIPPTNSKRQYVAEVFLCAGNNLFAAGGCSVYTVLVADGTYHTASINLAGLSYWKGSVNKLRLDLFDSGRFGDTIYLKDITLAV